MRILNVAYAYPPFFWAGGPPLKVRAIAEHLSGRGHEVGVLTSNRFPGVFTKVERVGDVDVTYLGCWFGYRSSFTFNPAVLAFCLKRLRSYEVVHIYGLNDFLGPVVAVYCRRWGIPYVVEPLGMYRPLVRSFRKKKLYRSLVAEPSMMKADRIIATAEKERDELVAGGIPKDHVVVRRNGIDLRDFATLPKRGRFRHRIGVAGAATLLLFLGRLSPVKRLDSLLEAFSQVKEPRGTLVLVGPDEDGHSRRLKSVAQRLGVEQEVIFAGPIYGPERIEALVDADLLILPSASENFGNSAGEAVAAGTPVIVTDRCGISAHLRSGGGLVIDLSVESLRSGIERLTHDRDLRSSLARETRRVAQGLSWEEPIMQMEELYRRMIEGLKK